MTTTGAESRRGTRAVGPLIRSARIVVSLAAVVGALLPTGCGTSSPTVSPLTTLAPDSVRDTGLIFRVNRPPVLVPGAECVAFTPEVNTIVAVPQGVRATTMVPGHGCWVDGAHGNVLSVMTTATSFGKFWRRTYPDDDGSGITATMVDKDSAQLFERFLIDGRYYAVRVGSQWTAGLDSGATKTACMLVVDTGSSHPLLINLTQQVGKSDPAVRTVAQQCATAATVAHTILDQNDPGGGSRVS